MLSYIKPIEIVYEVEDYAYAGTGKKAGFTHRCDALGGTITGHLVRSRIYCIPVKVPYGRNG